MERRRAPVVAAAAAALLMAGCSGTGSKPAAAPSAAAPSGVASSGSASASSTPGAAPTATVDPQTQASDRFLIQTMYDRINNAFAHDPNAGLRAVIASQYPEDSQDVDFTRCVRAIIPGAKALPPHFILTFSPHWDSMEPDPGYRITTLAGKQLTPRGRIYTTLVGIAGNGVRPGDHQRHQVVRDGRAYQFSTC